MGGWGWSYYWKVGAEHFGAKYFLKLEVNRGDIELAIADYHAAVPHWWWIHGEAYSYTYHFDAGYNHAFMGFFIGSGPTPPAGTKVAMLIPLWFPTLLSALLLWFAWRKTRPKNDPKRCFTVEVKAS